MSWYGAVINHILIKSDIVHNSNSKYESNAYTSEYQEFVRENTFNLYLQAKYLLRFLTTAQRAYLPQVSKEAQITSDYLIQQLDLGLSDEAEFHYRFLSFLSLLSYVKPASNFFQREELFINDTESQDMKVMRITINLCILAIFARTFSSNLLSDTHATVLGDIVARFHDLFAIADESCPKSIAYHLVIDLLLYNKFPKEMSTLSLEQMRSRISSAESMLELNHPPGLWKVAGIEKNDISNSALSKLRKAHDIKNMNRMLLSFVDREYSKLPLEEIDRIHVGESHNIISRATAQLNLPIGKRKNSDATSIIRGLLEELKTAKKRLNADKSVQSPTDTNRELKTKAHEAKSKLNQFETRKSTYTDHVTESITTKDPRPQVRNSSDDDRYKYLMNLLRERDNEIIKVSTENRGKTQHIKRLEEEHKQKVDQMNKTMFANTQKIAELERSLSENAKSPSSRYASHILERKLREAEEKLNQFKTARPLPLSLSTEQINQQSNQSAKTIQELSGRLHQCMYTVTLREMRIRELAAHIANLTKQLEAKDQLITNAQQLIERQKVHLLQLGNDYFSASQEKESLKQKLNTLTNRNNAINNPTPKLSDTETKLVQLESELSNCQKLLETRTVEREIQNNTIIGLQDLLRTREQDLHLIVEEERQFKDLVSEKDRLLDVQDKNALSLRLQLGFASHNVIDLNQLLPVQKTLGATTSLELINFQTDIKTLYVVNDVMDKIRVKVNGKKQRVVPTSDSTNKALDFPTENDRPLQKELRGQVQHHTTNENEKFTHNPLDSSQKDSIQTHSTSSSIHYTTNEETPSKRFKISN
ncbi:BA75_00946T0 [Komagataella pastoris]|uniref:BA75_00946T0 n=1 Tax=Komagataella pastoris TaxID=4922 RepID=A0A1B2J9V7_PICPA|nr:BA75_00946T0 [Komagataella pastoris]